MSFYSEMAAVATELLNEFGKIITAKRITGGSINPVTGVVVPGTVSTLTAKGVLVGYEDSLIDGTRITASDRLLIMDTGFEPLMTDTIQVNGQPWRVERILPKDPAGTALVYKVQVRR